MEGAWQGIIEDDYTEIYLDKFDTDSVAIFRQNQLSGVKYLISESTSNLMNGYCIMIDDISCECLFNLKIRMKSNYDMVLIINSNKFALKYLDDLSIIESRTFESKNSSFAERMHEFLEIN